MSISASATQAKLAVFLIVAAANVGIFGRLFIEGAIAQGFFVLTRVWMLALPGAWFLWVERGKLSWPRPTKQHSLVGVMLGILMFGLILSVYVLVGRQWIDSALVSAKAAQIGIVEPGVYLLGAFYFTFINSLIEEYIWRWFVCRQCEVFLPQNGVIYVSALCFTLHHIIALTAYTKSWPVVILGSLGVFIAGSVWSWCYVTYRDLWPCYVSHLLADLAIALIGWHLLFGK